MEGLRASQPAQDHDLGCARVHAPLLTPRAAFRPGPHPPVRLSGQPLPHSKAATLPHSVGGLPTVHASRFSQPHRYQHRRPPVLSDLQAGAVDSDRISPPRTAYYFGHFMTQSRYLSSSSFYSPSRPQPVPARIFLLRASHLLLPLFGQPLRSLASPRATPSVPLQAFWASGSSAKRHSIPSRLVRLSSMHSIGSARAEVILVPEHLLARALPIECFSLSVVVQAIALPRIGRLSGQSCCP